MVFIKEAGDYIIKETRGNRTTSKCVVSRLVSVCVCVCVYFIYNWHRLVMTIVGGLPY